MQRRQQDPGHPAKATADGKRYQSHPAHADAHQAGRVRVARAGGERLAQVGASEEQDQGAEGDRGDDDDQEVLALHRHVSDPDVARQARVGDRVVAPEQDVDGVRRDPEPERDDQRGQRRSARPADRDQPDQQADRGRDEHRQRLGRDVRHAMAQQRIGDEARDDREHALGEIDHARHAVDGDEAGGDQREGAAGGQPAGEQEQKTGHEASSTAPPRYAAWTASLLRSSPDGPSMAMRPASST